MKIEWLVVNATAVGSPDIVECAMYFGGGFGLVFFWPIQAVFVSRELLCG